MEPMRHPHPIRMLVSTRITRSRQRDRTTPPNSPSGLVKLQMKTGGCWRSVRTAARYCLIRSYLGTARHHGIHPLDALRDAMAGDPWMPPQTS